MRLQTLMRPTRLRRRVRAAALLLAALSVALAPGCIQMAPRGPCLHLALDPESASLRAGEGTAFQLRAQNCGDVTLTLGDGGVCDPGNGLNLTFEAEGIAYRVGHLGGAIPANRTDAHVCATDLTGLVAAPRAIQPGESQQVALAWNGTLMESTCFSQACGERYHDAPAGDYTLLARVQPREGGGVARTILVHLAPRAG